MKKTNNSDNDVKNAGYALLAMIPSTGAFADFKADMRKGFSDVMPALLDYAASRGLIREKTETALLAFLAANPPAQASAVEGRTFSNLLAQALGTRSVNSILESINVFADRFRMMPVQASMFSRLKKNFHLNTPKKRNALRLLAFWAGLKRPELGWNYEMLLALADAGPVEPVAVEETEGVRIAFALQATGDILDVKAVDWLKSELHRCIHDLNLNYIQTNKIAFTLSTAHIDIPKAPGPSGEPRLYARAIRDSLALAYQMPIRWALSAHSSRQRSIIISVSAGPFDQADKYIQALFSARKMGITSIRMTDFTRLCVKLADVKIVFRKTPGELIPGFLDEAHINVWHVDYFWSYRHYDFVPQLFEANVLPTTREAYETFRNELFFPDQTTSSNRALAALRKFPQDALLAIEIVRALIAKRMFYEADEVLSIILASDPRHMIARACRLRIYHYLSSQQRDPEISEHLFSKAVQEAVILEEYHPGDTEVLVERGLLHYARGVQTIAAYRKQQSRLGLKESVRQASNHLDQAFDFFSRGASISPITDMRAEFWKRQSEILQALLLKDQRMVMNGQPINDRLDLVYEIAMRFWAVVGWLPDDSPEGHQFFLDRLGNLLKQSAEDASITNWTPGMKCVFAIQLWSAAPHMTVFIAKLIIYIIQEAVSAVDKLAGHDIGIYSAAGCYTLIQSSDHFIKNARKYIDIVKTVLKDDLDKPDDYLISRDKIRSVALPFALIDDEAESEIIFKTDIKTKQ